MAGGGKTKTQYSRTVEVEDLIVAYDAKPALWDIDPKVLKGKLMAVAGLNGAGKTTLIKVMLGLLEPVTGAVRSLDGGSDVRMLENWIDYVPQSGSVDQGLPTTALDVALMGCYGKLGWIRRPRKVDVELSRRMLAKVGVEEYSSRQTSQLLGGRQQRVFLAWALVQEAEAYFMGEPFEGMDAQTEQAIVTLLEELKEQEKTVVVVHHDLQTIPNYFGWVTLIDLCAIASGPVEEVFHEENLKKTYHSSGTLLRSVG